MREWPRHWICGRLHKSSLGECVEPWRDWKNLLLREVSLFLPISPHHRIMWWVYLRNEKGLLVLMSRIVWFARSVTWGDVGWLLKYVTVVERGGTRRTNVLGWVHPSQSARCAEMNILSRVVSMLSSIVWTIDRASHFSGPHPHCVNCGRFHSEVCHYRTNVC